MSPLTLLCPALCIFGVFGLMALIAVMGSSAFSQIERESLDGWRR